jgi:tRNA G18 (ribose-2'-O)-methylase SpoU
MRKKTMSELERASVEDFKASAKAPFVFVLDNIRSLNNVGSFFRTADAFAFEGICLCGITAKPPHRDIQKTALGATESVDWRYFETAEHAAHQLKSEGFTIVAIEQAEYSIALQEYPIGPEDKYALVFGHEVEGVSDELMAIVDQCIEIPQFGTKHSLNVSVSAGVVAWDLFRKWKWPSRAPL